MSKISSSGQTKQARAEKKTSTGYCSFTVQDTVPLNAYVTIVVFVRI